jgi:hypothetical protein
VFALALRIGVNATAQHTERALREWCELNGIDIQQEPSPGAKE